MDDVRSSLDMGAWKVTVDCAEIRSPEGEIRQDLFDALLKVAKQEDMIFEVWAVPIWGGHTHQIRDAELWLINQFGPEVNIANLQHNWVFALEALRRGVGININSILLNAAPQNRKDNPKIKETVIFPISGTFIKLIPRPSMNSYCINSFTFKKLYFSVIIIFERHLE